MEKKKSFAMPLTINETSGCSCQTKHLEFKKNYNAMMLFQYMETIHFVCKNCTRCIQLMYTKCIQNSAEDLLPALVLLGRLYNLHHFVIIFPLM